MSGKAYVFVAIEGLCVAISVLVDRFMYDDPEKWRWGIVQSLKFLRDVEKTLEEFSAKLEGEGVEREEET